MVRSRKRGIKGAGSVYQRKSDGRWVGSFVVEETGQRKSVYAPKDNNTEKAAYALLQQALRQQEQGTLATGSDQTLEQYLPYWLEKVRKPTIRITSYVRYRTYVDKHLIPKLGRLTLRKLTAQQVQVFVAAKADEGLAPSTIKKIYTVLHSALDHAVKLKFVSENVCKGVTLPKNLKGKKQKGMVLTEEQIKKLVEVANTHKMGAFIKLGLMSGMRHGEMLSLRWANIDFEKGILSVVHNVTYIAGYGFIEGEPKTEDGIRRIILPPFVVKALRAYRERQQVQKERAGAKWKENDLVFCTRTGGYIVDGDNLKRFRKVLLEAGFPPDVCAKMRVHDLRHNVATFLINVLHYPATLVQALLGHSDIAITLGMYVDTDPEMLRPMMDDLDKLFGEE